MNYKLLITFATLALIIASCAKNEIIEPQPRVMHITATVEEPASTRATLQELETGAIRFKWVSGDIIQMAFVQGDVKKTANAEVTTVIDDGRTAQFTVTVPTEITAGDFTLYAYRSSRYSNHTEGGSQLLSTDPVIAVLPERTWEYVGLLSNAQGQPPIVSLWDKKTVTYSGGGAMPDVALTFKHLGAMMTVKIKNTTGAEIEDIASLQFISTSGTHWLRNHSGNGMAHFNMEEGNYVAGQELTNYIFKLNTNPGYGYYIQPGETTSFSQWFAPGAYTEANPIKVDAYNSAPKVIGTTGTGTKNALNFQPGNNYVLYLKIGAPDATTPEGHTYKLQYSNAAWD